MSSFSHEINQAWSNGARSISAGKTYTDTGEPPSVDEVIEADATNQEVVFTLDVSQLKAIIFLAEGALTLKTNNADVPVDTLVLKAGIPYIWTVDSYDTFKITNDVTVLFVTEGESVAKRLQIEGVHHATP